MAIMKRVGQARASSSVSNPTSWLLSAFGANASAAGVAVTDQSANTFTAFAGAVNVIAQDVSSLPIKAYERISTGGKRPASDSYLWKLLHDRANPEITNQRLWYLSTRDVLVTGNSYLEVVRDMGGRPVELWYLPPNSRPFRSEGVRYLDVPTADGENQVLTMGPGGQAIQIMGDGGNEWGGASVVRQYMDAIGLGLATERFGARFFGAGARPGGFIEVENKFRTTEDKNKFVRDFQAAQGGLGNSHRVAILEKGMKFSPAIIPPDDAQFLETRKFQVTEMARIFRLPPHKIQDLEKATFSNIEEQQLQYLGETLRFRLVAMEQVFNHDLIPTQDRGRLYSEFLVDGLLRGNTAARFAAYNVARMGGWMNADEIRSFENMNPLPDGQGQVYWVPLNMANASDLSDETDDLDESTEGQRAIEAGVRFLGERQGDRRRLETPVIELDEYQAARDRRPVRTPNGRTPARPTWWLRGVKNRHRLQRKFLAMFEDAAARTVKREVDRVGKIARRTLVEGESLTNFLVEITEFYSEHRKYVARQMRPVLEAYAAPVWADAADEVGGDPDMSAADERFVSDVATSVGIRVASSGEGQIRQIADNNGPTEVQAAVETRLDQWTEKKPTKIASRETVQAGAAIAKQAWVAAGVTKLVWRTVGDDCPMCEELSGAVVGIETSFVAAGETVPNGDNAPITPSRSIGHPPLHEGCDCSISPG